MTSPPIVESTWRALVPASWSDSSARRFVHFEAGACPACRGVEQTPQCRTCAGGRYLPTAELERSHPASSEACTFFAREAHRLSVVEDAAREVTGSATQRLRWKTATERPFGATWLDARERSALLEETAVAIERVTDDALTLVAFGVACACHEAEWQRRPAHVTKWVGTDQHHGEVTVDTCLTCGASWLEYLYEDHFDNGSRYRGLIDARVTVTSENAAALLERLPWYWLGGTYHFGKTSRSSGPVRWH